MATDFEPGSVQYQWMENDLASVNRSVTPFVIFTAHRCAPAPSPLAGSFPFRR